MISFDESICSDYGLARRKEWLETNALGGYASSTIMCLNTSRYHGLLVADIGGGLGRFVFLSKLEEALMVGHLRYMLSTGQRRESIFPRGYESSTAFRLAPFPIFTYQIQDVKIEKSIFMVHGQNTVVITYEVKEGAQDARLELRPIVAFRDFAAMARETPTLNSTSIVKAGKVIIEPFSGLPKLHFYHAAETYSDSPTWYRRVHYIRETEMGVNDEEDLYSPGFFVYHLQQGKPSAFVVSLNPDLDISQVGDFKDAELRRRKNLSKPLKKSNELLSHLMIAANSFVVRRYDEIDTMLAGYHWYGDWARDTFISMPGVLLHTGHKALAKKLLSAYAECSKGGLMPAMLPETDEETNFEHLDIPLWFIYAVYKYVLFTKENPFVMKKLYPVTLEIVAAYLEDDVSGLTLDADYLLSADGEGVRASWVDSRPRDRILLQRMGKTVDLNALWYNALMMVAALARRFRKSKAQREMSQFAGRVKRSFNASFWNGKARCLYDSVEGKTHDHTVRANQILAIGLPFSILPRAKHLAVLRSVEKHLLTPYGLRSLSSKDKNYCGRYSGDQKAREAAYYNGTVWPWLFGPYLTAYLSINKTKKAKLIAKEMLEPFMKHLADAGLGTVSEIFDGDNPHAPRGCISQAWSVGELIRVINEEKLV